MAMHVEQGVSADRFPGPYHHANVGASHLVRPTSDSDKRMDKPNGWDSATQPAPGWLWEGKRHVSSTLEDLKESRATGRSRICMC